MMLKALLVTGGYKFSSGRFTHVDSTEIFQHSRWTDAANLPSRVWCRKNAPKFWNLTVPYMP